MPASKTSSLSSAPMQKRFARRAARRRCSDCGQSRLRAGPVDIAARGTARHRHAHASALVTLIDVPFVSSATVRTLIPYSASAARRSCVRYQTAGMAILLFSAASVRRSSTCRSSLRCQAVVRAHAAAIVEVPVDDEGAFIDIDTREDYERVLGPFPKEAPWS